MGAVQGLLEWLPVSSSGQSMLVLLGVFGLSAQAAFTYGIFFHIGTLAAVLVKYRGECMSILEDTVLFRFLAITTVFTGVSGLGLYYLVKKGLSTFSGEFLNGLVGLLLVLTGIILYSTRKCDFGVKDVTALSLSESAVVGLVQGFSVLPGISRSGATVSALVLSEVRQEEALRLSFLMSVPAVAGAVVLEVVSDGLAKVDLGVAAAGVIASFAVGYAMMEALVAYARRIRFDLFCISFGLLAVAYAVIL